MSESSGVLTGAALLAGITASGEMSEPPTPASSITVTDLDNLRVFQRVGSSRDITVAGTYGGSPSGIQARAVPDGTSLSSTGYAWTTIDAAPSGGTFSAALSVPTGGWYNIQVRDTAASSTAAPNSGPSASWWRCWVRATWLTRSRIRAPSRRVTPGPSRTSLEPGTGSGTSLTGTRPALPSVLTAPAPGPPACRRSTATR